jgi:hypothetical protein
MVMTYTLHADPGDFALQNKIVENDPGDEYGCEKAGHNTHA